MKKLLLALGLVVLLGGSYACKGRNDGKNTQDTTVNSENTTSAPAPAPVVVNEDDQLRRGVQDATKDFPGVTATVDNGVITLTGSIERSRYTTLKQSLDALRPRQVVNNLNLK